MKKLKINKKERESNLLQWTQDFTFQGHSPPVNVMLSIPCMFSCSRHIVMSLSKPLTNCGVAGIFLSVFERKTQKYILNHNHIKDVQCQYDI